MNIQDTLFEQYAYTLECLSDEPDTSDPKSRKRLLKACARAMQDAKNQFGELLRMRDRIERLRGALKSSAGRFYALGESTAGDECMEWAGDMEPPLVGSNVQDQRPGGGLPPEGRAGSPG